MNIMCSNERKVNEERSHLLNIFPEEIWLKLFDKITNQDDQERFSNSTLFLRSLFLPQRTQFLLKNVWGILGRKYEENITKPGSAYREDYAPVDNGDAQLDQEESDNDDDIIEDLHLKKLLINLIYRIRSVCTSWSDAVSYFYQTHPLHFEPCTYPPSTIVEKWTYSKTQDKFSDETPQAVSVFLYHFHQTHDSCDRNPFFGKSVIIELTYGDSGTQIGYVTNLFYLLSTYGHHIWYCTMKINDVFSSREALYCRIVAVLKMMANLKVLRLFIQPHWTYCNGIVRPDLFDELQTEINAQPLPTLKDLKMLSTWNVITPIFQELVRSSSHVTTLEIVRMEEQDDYDIYTVPLPNLKNLSISFYSQQDFEKIMDPKVKWSLSKLCINIDPVEFIEWQRIFAVLEEKCHLLTHLKIHLPEARKWEHKNGIYQKGAALQLRLPHLKCLDMTMRNLTCLDFLLTLKNSLLDLHIRTIVNGDVDDGFADADNVERRGIIKFLSCASRPFESNIWTLFPKMDRASLDYYTRLYSRTYSGYLTEREEWSHSRREWENKTIGGDIGANATLT